MAYNTSQRKLLEFVRTNQIVAESAKGLPVPSLVRYMVGTEYSGGWWSLENSSTIYNALQTLRDREEILVCKLAKGKITLVHEDSHLPLVSLATRFPSSALDRIVEQHEADGRHRTTKIPVGIWWTASRLFIEAPLSEADALQRLDELAPGLSRVVQRLFA